MSHFSFHGSVAASKSLMNRALIIQSYAPGIRLIGESQSDDVRLMTQALKDLKSGLKEFDCGEAGTVLRFLMLRVSREKGQWLLKGSPRLLSRPAEGLIQILSQLGVRVDKKAHGFLVISEGWQIPDQLFIEVNKSSQFASAVLLNSWNLPRDLSVAFVGEPVSAAYMDMTLKMAEYFGLQVTSPGSSPASLKVSSGSSPRSLELAVEPDLSSCFALVACAAYGGQIMIDNFPQKSWQPDVAFVDLIQQMNIPCRQNLGQLVVGEAESIHPIQCDLTNTPDLFPVLAMILARADGASKITGIEHLVYKESNRLENVQKLLEKLGRGWFYEKGIFTIFGQPEPFKAEGDFDPDQDHRMAMAAQVANMGGARLEIKNKSVVSKSFPEFWQRVGEECTP